MLREHRHDAIHKIYGCGSLLSLFVDDSVRLDIMGHISNVNTHFITSIRQDPE